MINLKVEVDMLKNERLGKDMELEILKHQLEELRAGKSVAKRLSRVSQNKLIMNLDDLTTFDSRLQKKNENLGKICDDFKKHGITMVLESYLGYLFTTEFDIASLKETGLLELSTDC